LTGQRFCDARHLFVRHLKTLFHFWNSHLRKSCEVEFRATLPNIRFPAEW
jgi:hypothetical protein